MDDKQLLEAMQGMIQENNKALAQMMDEKIDGLRQDMSAKFDAIDVQLADIKEDTAITRSATNSLIEWAEDVGVLTQVKFPVKKAK